MALCYAQSFAAGAGTPTAKEHGGAMVTHEQHSSTADHAEHGVANTAHDCCDDSATSSCCGAVEALKTKSTPDIDLQFTGLAWCKWKTLLPLIVGLIKF